MSLGSARKSFSVPALPIALIRFHSAYRILAASSHSVAAGTTFLIIHPECFLSAFLDGVAEFGRSVVAFEISVKCIHEIAAIARYGSLTLDSVNRVGKSFMLVVGHLVAVGLAVSSGRMRIRWITIKQGPL